MSSRHVQTQPDAFTSLSWTRWRERSARDSSIMSFRNQRWSIRPGSQSTLIFGASTDESGNWTWSADSKSRGAQYPQKCKTWDHMPGSRPELFSLHGTRTQPVRVRDMRAVCRSMATRPPWTCREAFAVVRRNNPTAQTSATRDRFSYAVAAGGSTALSMSPTTRPENASTILVQAAADCAALGFFSLDNQFTCSA